MSWVFLIHLTATLLMTGIIILIQSLVYPGFTYVSESTFHRFHARHMQVMGWVAAPLMLIEAGSGCWLLLDPAYRTSLLVISICCLLPVWLSTFLLQVPCHKKLSTGYDRHVIQRLARTNIIRTVSWSVRSALLLTFLQTQLP